MKTPIVMLVGALGLCAGVTRLPGAPSTENLPTSGNPAGAAYRDPSVPVEKRVEDLLARMTLEEKIGQVTQLACGKNTNPNNVNLKIGDIRMSPGLVGSFLCYPEAREARKRLQQEVLKGSRLGIPAIFGADVIHGHRTCFPQPIAQACTFDPALITAACTAIARETKASGLDWTFAPLCDVSRDPRWGRMVETFGEDQHLVGVMSAASVRGYQAPIYGGGFGIAACLKHYVGYGASEAGIDYAATEISDQTMQDVYLPPFKAAIDAGAKTVMSGFNNVGGIPMTGNRHLLTDVLRGQLGFKGFVVSDFSGPLQLGPEFSAMAPDTKESARLALHAGVDLDMMDGLYAKHVAELVANGELAPAELDEAVRRILRVKFECGLFEHPFTPEVPEAELYLRPETLDLAQQVAEDSFVLLKNEKGLLPLGVGAGTIALIGPFADEKKAMNGTWSSFSNPSDTVSIREGLEAIMGATTKIDFVKGSDAYSGEVDRENVRRAVAGAGVVVLCLGDTRNGENMSRCSLDLPPVQAALAEEVFKAGKPVVLLMTCGKPVIMNRQAEKSAAVMLVWQGGTRAGVAVAKVLAGATSPSGRLSFSWPRHQGQIPIYYSKRRTNRPHSDKNWWTSHYMDESLDPLYPFGHGTGYSQFEYGAVRLPATELRGKNRLVAEVTVTNRGSMTAKEPVLWYLSASHGGITRPVKLLRHFEKSSFAPGESRTLRFEIDPVRDLSYPNAKGETILEAAEFTLNVNDATLKNASGAVKFTYRP